MTKLYTVLCSALCTVGLKHIVMLQKILWNIVYYIFSEAKGTPPFFVVAIMCYHDDFSLQEEKKGDCRKKLRIHGAAWPGDCCCRGAEEAHYTLIYTQAWSDKILNEKAEQPNNSYSIDIVLLCSTPCTAANF